MKSLLRYVLAIMIFLGMSVILIVFALYLWARDTKQLEARMLDQATAMATVIEGAASGNYGQNSRVLVNMLMSRLVNLSRNEAWDFQIKNLFLLDTAGKVIAHSDIMHVARSMSKNYKKPEYFSVVQSTSPQQPIKIRPLSFQKTELANLFLRIERYSPFLARVGRHMLPEKAPSAYHISVTCYHDNRIGGPVGSLHLRGRPKDLALQLSPQLYYQQHPLHLVFFCALSRRVFVGSEQPVSCPCKG